MNRDILSIELIGRPTSRSVVERPLSELAAEPTPPPSLPLYPPSLNQHFLRKK
jgi:hypothetical protein